MTAEQLDIFAQPEEDRAAADRAAATVGQALAEEGMARAEQSAGDWDIAVIDQAIGELARSGRAFSANDVRPLLPQVRTPAIGARFAAARKRDEITPIGYTPSTDPGTHGHPVRMWRGTGRIPPAQAGAGPSETRPDVDCLEE